MSSDNMFYKIDCHGFSLAEAREEVSAFLRGLPSSCDAQVITGRGLHSPDGVAVLQPAIETLIKHHPDVENSFLTNKGGAINIKTKSSK